MKCTECNRPRPTPKPPEPTDAIIHCAGCNVRFSLDELSAMFSEANLLDSNHARRFRRVIVDDLIMGLRRRGAT